MTSQEESLKLVREELRKRLQTFSPADLNPELVRLKIVEKLCDDKNYSLSELNDRERKAISQLLAIAEAYKYKDGTNIVHGGLPICEAFAKNYIALGSCLDRKREDAVVACLRPRSGYNYKMGPGEDEQDKPSLIQKVIALITGKKEK